MNSAHLSSAISFDVRAVLAVPEAAAPRIDALSEAALADVVKHDLRTKGYGLALGDTWGKIVDDGTAYLEIGADATLAWVYMPEQDGFLGSRLHVAGIPEVAVPEAMRQLDIVLQAHAQSGSETISDVSTWEANVA